LGQFSARANYKLIYQSLIILIKSNKFYIYILKNLKHKNRNMNPKKYHNTPNNFLKTNLPFIGTTPPSNELMHILLYNLSILFFFLFVDNSSSSKCLITMSLKRAPMSSTSKRGSPSVLLLRQAMLTLALIGGQGRQLIEHGHKTSSSASAVTFTASILHFGRGHKTS